MTQAEPTGIYVYQPYGMQDRARWAAGRIFGVGGLPLGATVDGLTHAEAQAVKAALESGQPPARQERAALFVSGFFWLASGVESAWKIECDALTDDDWRTVADIIRSRLGPYAAVEGVPSGGLRLAAELRRFTTMSGPLLIVDDVLTTGGSLERQRAGREAIGAVVFARGLPPPWVTPLFQVAVSAAHPLGT